MLPISHFTLSLDGGSKGLIAKAAESLCAEPRRATVRMVGQNGKVIKVKQKIQLPCPKKSKKHQAGRRPGKEGPLMRLKVILALTAALAMSSLWASSAQALETHNFISSVSSSAELLNPYGAAVDDSGSASAGDLYVVIPPAAPPKVIKFDADGNEISKIDNSNLAGCPGATDFNNPFGVAVDPSNGERLRYGQRRQHGHGV